MKIIQVVKGQDITTELLASVSQPGLVLISGPVASGKSYWVQSVNNQVTIVNLADFKNRNPNSVLTTQDISIPQIGDSLGIALDESQLCTEMVLTGLAHQALSQDKSLTVALQDPTALPKSLIDTFKKKELPLTHFQLMESYL